jgi:hypothetical protein
MTAGAVRLSALLSVTIVILLSPQYLLAEEFSFDAAAFQKKPFEIGGYVELNANHMQLDRGAALYFLNLQQQRPRKNIDQNTATLQLEGKFGADKLKFNFLSQSSLRYDHLGEEDDTRFFEAYASYQPTSGLTIDAGKKALKWGKGYAWNPVAFVERPKDPNDPDLNREGFKLVTADYIRSYPSDLKTLAITPVVLPVYDNTNKDFGQPDNVNFGLKTYLLYKDTDIDVMFLTNGSRSARYGIDFSKNITTNFELHGEFAYLSNVEKTVIDASANTHVESHSANNYLLGLRYLTANETTIISEYYHNGAGFSRNQLDDFYHLVRSAENTSNTSLLNRLQQLARQGYARRNPGRNYFYLRLSNKEPFDILYFVPSITTIVNLDDGSYTLAPELLYTGITNLELRARATFLQGQRQTEFGEKQNDNRLEFRLRFFF